MRKIMLLTLMLAALVLGACGNKPKEKAEATPAAAEKDDQEVKEEENAEAEEKESAEKPEQEENQDSGDILNPYIAELTGGDVKVVFTNKNPGLAHSYSDDVSITIDEYQIVHVSNMNESQKVNFYDAEEGYVLTYKATLDNQSDQDVYYHGGTTMLSDDGKDHLMKKSNLVDREDWLKDSGSEGASQFTKGKSFTGMDAYMITKEQYEKLKAPIFKLPEMFLDDDPGKTFGTEAVFALPVNEEGMEKAKASASLYPDKMVTETIADKELFYSKEDINQTKEIDQVQVTLQGVQYANVTPTEANKERFRNFGDGPLVALTAKLTVENGSDIPFDKMFIDRRLIIDQDRGTMLSQGMLEPTLRGNVEPGQKVEVLAVFLFRKDEFDIFKKFELQVGPLADENAKKLFKEKSVQFELPMKPE